MFLFYFEFEHSAKLITSHICEITSTINVSEFLSSFFFSFHSRVPSANHVALCDQPQTETKAAVDKSKESFSSPPFLSLDVKCHEGKENVKESWKDTAQHKESVGFDFKLTSYEAWILLSWTQRANRLDTFKCHKKE